HFEAFLARQVDHDAGIVRIVLDDEQDRVAGLNLEPIVGNLLDRPLLHCGHDGHVYRLRRAGGGRLRRGARSDISQRQIQREGAARAGRAAQLDFAAEEVGQLTADGQPQPGAAVFAAGAGIRLHEGLENDLLFLVRNTDAGIGNFESHDRRRLLEDGMLRTPAALHLGNAQAHAALRGELERVRKQVLENLLQALGIGGEAASEIGIETDIERKLTRFRLVAERARNHVDKIGEYDVFRIHRDGSGFDLGEIENVADQVQQVGAGAVNGAGELDLLGLKIALRVVRELLPQN